MAMTLSHVIFCFLVLKFAASSLCCFSFCSVFLFHWCASFSMCSQLKECFLSQNVCMATVSVHCLETWSASDGWKMESFFANTVNALNWECSIGKLHCLGEHCAFWICCRNYLVQWPEFLGVSMMLHLFKAIKTLSFTFLNCTHSNVNPSFFNPHPNPVNWWGGFSCITIVHSCTVAMVINSWLKLSLNNTQMLLQGCFVSHWKNLSFVFHPLLSGS